MPESSPTLNQRYGECLYCMPRLASSLGLASSIATRLWQTEQSLVMLSPVLVLWLPSWQRKHPG